MAKSIKISYDTRQRFDSNFKLYAEICNEDGSEHNSLVWFADDILEFISNSLQYAYGDGKTPLEEFVNGQKRKK